MDGARSGWKRMTQRWKRMWRRSRGSRPALRVGLGFQVELLEIILDLHPNAANSLTTGSWGRPGWEIAGLILVQWQ